MNVQVILLVGITGLFMLAWNGDPACCKDEHAVAVYPAPLRVYAADTIERAVAANQARPVFQSTVVARVASANPDQAVTAAFRVAPHAVERPLVTIRESETAANRPIPIPAKLPGGHYRAVSNRGDVREIILPVNDSDQSPEIHADFYTAEANGVCWYFARINK